jgi:hypothetical protein
MPKTITMKLWLFILAALIFAAISSCKKTESIENVGLVGKWQLKEVFDGYANGGHFQWNNVSKDDSHSLEFAANGQFFRKENKNGNFQECTGTYQFQTDNNLEINSICSTTIEEMKVNELTSTILIINRQGREGTIRYKYSAIK